MTKSATPPRAITSSCKLQTRFLQIRDRIETHARIYFRSVRCWWK